ncbi:hypothetical protein GCM10028793_27100 [Nocardiopsis oceani]
MNRFTSRVEGRGRRAARTEVGERQLSPVVRALSMPRTNPLVVTALLKKRVLSSPHTCGGTVSTDMETVPPKNGSRRRTTRVIRAASRTGKQVERR